MKKIIMMTMAAMFSLSMTAGNVNFKVSNMHCGNCAKRVEKALKANEAVSEVTVDLENQLVSVVFDDQKTDADALQKALTEAKFEAIVAKGCGGNCKHHENAEGENHGGCGHHGKQTE